VPWIGEEVRKTGKGKGEERKGRNEGDEREGEMHLGCWGGDMVVRGIDASGLVFN